MRLFGYHEFNLLRQAVLARLAALGRTISSLRGGDASQDQSDLGGNSLLQAWEALIRRVQPKGICRIDLRLASGPIEGRRHWIDAAHEDEGACHWSVSVSVQTRDGRACELRADGLEKPQDQAEIEVLTSLMRSFGTHVFELVEDTEVLPLMDEIRIVRPKPKLAHRRAA